MLLEIGLLICATTLLCAVAAFARVMTDTMKRIETLETALRGVKPALEEYPKLSNEIRDIRETLDELPLDELAAQAAYEKAYADGLEAINGYSVEVAMKGGGGDKN